MYRDIKPEYSLTRVRKAGENVRKKKAKLDDIIVIENWRASHNHILNAWQATLRRRCKKNKNVVFAQRLKRRKTIFDKLEREPTMSLTKMHDIAGCRLIFKDIKALNRYRGELHKAKFKHERLKIEGDPYNYIKTPAESGYRGIHDVYKFVSRDLGGKAWDGLQVEIQYRTVYQHAWATAVEIAGSLTGNHTKFDRGGADYKRFFSLASEIIARCYENSKSSNPDISDEDLLKEFNILERKIKLLKRLKNIKMVPDIIKAFSHLRDQNLILSNKEGHPGTRITGYPSLAAATKAYFEMEKDAQKGDDIVLVRADTHENIRQAFKNYFSDTNDFVNLVEQGLKKLKR